MTPADFFADAAIVSTYTAEEAIEDGTLAALPQRVVPSEPLFDLGRILATPGALELLERPGVPAVNDLLQRHAALDGGDLSADDQKANQYALTHGERIFSAYQIGDERVFVITEADRSLTTLLLSHEY